MRIPLSVRFSLACALAFAGGRAASAQCYGFSSGTAATLTLYITNLPAPVVTPLGGGIVMYSYTLSGIAGNTSSLTVGSTTYSAASPSNFLIDIDSSPYITSLNVSVSVTPLGQTPAAGAAVGLGGAGNLLPNGVLPAALPPISAWAADPALMVVGVGATDTTYTLTAITSCTAQPTQR